MVKDFIKKYWIYCLIFLLAFSLRVIGIARKTIVLFDTPATLIASTPNNLTPENKIAKTTYREFNFELAKDYTGKQVKQTLFGMSNYPKDIVKDLLAIRNNNVDLPHTNFYYSITRIIFTGIDGTNLKQIIRRGCALNLLFFCFSFFFLYKLLSLIKDDKKFISLGLFLSFVCAGSVSNCLMIREYALAEVFFILATYIFVKLYKIIQNNETSNITNLKIISYGCILALFSLSSYFSLIYEWLLFITLIIVAIQHKNYLMIKKLIYILLTTWLIVTIIYPSYIIGIFTNEQSGFVSNHSTEWFYSMDYSMARMIKFLIDFIFYKPILILLFAFGYIKLIYKKNTFLEADSDFTTEEKNIMKLLLGISFIWIGVVLTVCPNADYYQARYILPCTSILCLILVYLMYKIKLRYVVILLFFWALFFTAHLFKGEYKGLCTDSDRSKKFPKDEVMVIMTPYNWAIMNYLIYVEDNRTIRFEAKLPEDNYKHKKFMVITSYDKQEEMKKIGTLLFKDFIGGHNIYHVEQD